MLGEGNIVAEERMDKVSDAVWLVIEDATDCILLWVDSLRNKRRSRRNWLGYSSSACTYTLWKR